jgi:hypothetical protein
MNSEQLVVHATSLDAVVDALRAELAVFRETSDPPLSGPTKALPFEKRNRRALFVTDLGSGDVSIVENGGLADRVLAASISRRSRTAVTWLALHETLNAWGWARFVDGRLENEHLHPINAFDDDSVIEDVDYEGDATDEAFSFAETLRLPEAFVSYEQMAMGVTQNRPEVGVRKHLLFRR